MASPAAPYPSEPGAPEHFFGRIRGTYDGVVVDAGQFVQQITHFSAGKDGRPVARYVVQHPDGMSYPGTFEDAHLVGPRTVTFKWTDRHGEGVVMIEFTPDGASFDGNWGDDQVAAANVIRGTRKSVESGK